MEEKNGKQETPKTEVAVVEQVERRIMALQNSGEIDLPKDYSVGNALKSAWLIIQQTKDRSDKPALTVCSKASIYNALFSMVIQGLNADRKQGYFIVYGTTLSFTRSYFGTQVVARRIREDIAPGDYGIIANVIFKGDEFRYQTQRGRKIITAYETSFENQEKAEIRGAYCEVWSREGELIACEVMTLAEIHRSWAQSITKPFDENGKLKSSSTHAKFPVEMTKRTILNRTLKPLLNTATDKHLLKALSQADEIQAEEEAASVIAQEANQGEVIDIPAEVHEPPVIEPEIIVPVQSPAPPENQKPVLPDEIPF